MSKDRMNPTVTTTIIVARALAMVSMYRPRRTTIGASLHIVLQIGCHLLLDLEAILTGTPATQYQVTATHWNRNINGNRGLRKLVIRSILPYPPFLLMMTTSGRLIILSPRLGNPYNRDLRLWRGLWHCRILRSPAQHLWYPGFSVLLTIRSFYLTSLQLHTGIQLMVTRCSP